MPWSINASASRALDDLKTAQAAADASGDRPQPPIDLTAAAFFDVDNTLVQGSSAVHFGRGLAARNYFTYRDVLGFIYAQAKFQLLGKENSNDVAAGPAQSARVHRRPVGRGAGDARRGGLRRDHRRQDLGRHPRAHPDAPRCRPAGLADHRHALRARGHHRAPTRPDRGAGHGRRIGRRGIHRQAGRRDSARPRQGPRGAVAGHPRGPQPQTLHRLFRQLQRRADAVAGRHRGRDQSRRPRCAAWPANVAGRSATFEPRARPPGSGCRRRWRWARPAVRWLRWRPDANHADRLRR